MILLFLKFKWSLYLNQKLYFYNNFKNLAVSHTYILAILFIFFNNCSFNSFNFLTRVNPSHYLFNVPNFNVFFIHAVLRGGRGDGCYATRLYIFFLIYCFPCSTSVPCSCPPPLPILIIFSNSFFPLQYCSLALSHIYTNYFHMVIFAYLIFLTCNIALSLSPTLFPFPSFLVPSIFFSLCVPLLHISPSLSLPIN